MAINKPKIRWDRLLNQGSRGRAIADIGCFLRPLLGEGPHFTRAYEVKSTFNQLPLIFFETNHQILLSLAPLYRLWRQSIDLSVLINEIRTIWIQKIFASEYKELTCILVPPLLILPIRVCELEHANGAGVGWGWWVAGCWGGSGARPAAKGSFFIMRFVNNTQA